MTQRIAVAVVHGMGKKTTGFHDKFERNLRRQFAQELGSAAATAKNALVVRPVDYYDVLEKEQDELLRRMSKSGPMRWRKSRDFVVHFLADAIAYQPTPWNRETYDAVHAAFAASLRGLAKDAGGDAPLCVVAHSLGSIVASNYFYDLQKDFPYGKPPRVQSRLVPAAALREMRNTPLERGHTLAHFYTCGSTLPLWGLRYRNPKFGTPIRVPAEALAKERPHIPGEWVNFYDADDVLGYPFRSLNRMYEAGVRRDHQLNVGGMPWSMTPASHKFYFEDPAMSKQIASSVAQTWRVMALDQGVVQPAATRRPLIVSPLRRNRSSPQVLGLGRRRPRAA